MRKFKRLILLLLAGVILSGTLPIMSVTAKTSGVLTYEIYDGEVMITDCDASASGKITIPSKIDGKSVTAIGDSAFFDCINITGVTIPDGVKRIEWSAFQNCESLNDIVIPDSVSFIGPHVFYGTAYYNDSSNWNSRVLYIGNYLIEAENSIEDLYVKSGTKCIASAAFLNCTSLSDITIPDSVTDIGFYAFSGCTSLRNISMSDYIKSIGNEAFENTGYYNNPSNWQNDVLYIGEYLLKANDVSGAYVINPGTKCIADDAFCGCGKLTNITIPDSITSIGYGTFENCDSLTSVSVPDSVNIISESAFFNCSGLTSVKIGSGVKTIECYAFYGCGNLKTVKIPKNVKNIGQRAFGFKTEGQNTVKIADFEIRGYSGTAAQAYAKKNEFEFSSIDHTHSYTSKITEKATCTKAGVRTYTCSCGDSYTKKIDAKGHTYKSTTTRKATTSKNGSIASKCTACGKVKSTKTIYKISSVKLSNTSYTYNGKTKKPTVTVKNSKGNKLKKDTDYTVSYAKGRKNIGTYSVTVKFKGKYSGSKKLTFKIVPGKVTGIKQTNDKGINFKWNSVKGATGYQVYCYNSSKGKYVKLTTTTKPRLGNSKAKGSMKIKIRAYKLVGDRAYYGAFSNPVTLKSKK